jgi:GAF domain-containing protein/ANTAR domain-containing protein
MSDPTSDGSAATGTPRDAAVVRQKVEGDPTFELAGLLDEAIERQSGTADLDLSELDFMKSPRSATTHDVEERLAAHGVRLTTRLPLPLVNRLLDLMVMGDTTRALSHGEVGGGHDQSFETVTAPGIEHLPDRDGSMPDLRKVTAIPIDPDVVDGVLQLVVDTARTLVQGADGVSVSLLRHGHLATVAASDQTIMDMDADQYATGEGPCVDASRQGHPFHAAVLAGETRWPAFTPQALSLGINAILSSPLKAFEKPVGALNIYSRTPLAFSAMDQATAAAIAEKASVILGDAGVGVGDDQLAKRYKDALVSRRAITLATGVIMEREGVDEDQAFNDLLRLSLYHGQTLREQAENMVRSSRQPEITSESGLDE